MGHNIGAIISGMGFWGISSYACNEKGTPKIVVYTSRSGFYIGVCRVGFLHGVFEKIPRSSGFWVQGLQVGLPGFRLYGLRVRDFRV